MSAVWRGCGTPHPIRKRVPTSLGAAPAGPGRGGGGSPAGTRTAALFARGTFSGPGGRGPRRGTRPQLQAGRGLMLEVSKTYERPGISIRRPVTAKVIFRKFDTCRCQMRDEPCIAQHVTARPHACHTSPRRTLKGGDACEVHDQLNRRCGALSQGQAARQAHWGGGAPECVAPGTARPGGVAASHPGARDPAHPGPVGRPALLSGEAPS